MADLYSTQSPFVDKEADQADLDRQNKIDLATISAVSKAMGSAGAGTAPSSGPFGGAAGAAPATNLPSPKQMGVESAPAAPQDPYAAFSKLLEETDPSLVALRKKATAAAQSQLDNPAAAFDAGAAISREDLARNIQTAREQTREDLIKTYGSNASQVMPQLRSFDQGAILETRDLNRRLTADRATASQSALAQAIASAMGITGQASDERKAAASLGLQAAGQTEQARQFEKNLATNTAEAEKQRVFASAEAALGRAFTTTEREAIQAYQTAERKGAQDFAAAEAALGRKFTTAEREAIQAYQTAERVASQDFASAEAALGRAFTSAERQAVQDFQKAERLGAQDFAAAEAALGRKFTTAEREAIQAYQTSERVASQVYASAEADLGRKFTSSERQAVQDFQRAERLGAQDFQSAEALLGRKFTTEEREAIQAYQTKERLSAQDFQQMMTEKGYVHDTDLEIMRSNLQKELQANGIAADQAKQQADQKFQELVQQREQAFQATQTELQRKWATGERIGGEEAQKSIQANEFRQQDALARLQSLTQQAIAEGGWNNALKLQAEQLLAQATQAEKDRSAQYLMFSAQMAQEDQQFAAEFGLKQEEVRANVENAKAQIGIALSQLGIAKEQWAAQKDEAAFTKALELAQYGVSMWNGENEEALQPFVSKLAQTLGQGLGLDAAVMEKAIASAFPAGTGAGAANGTGTAADLDKATSKVDAIAATLPAKVNVDQVKNVLSQAAKGGFTKYDATDLAKLPGADKYLWVVNGTTGVHVPDKITPKPEAMDYLGFHRLTQMGVPEKDAADLITTAIGAERFKAAYKAMTGKDWK